MLSQVKTKSYHCLSGNGKWMNIVACPPARRPRPTRPAYLDGPLGTLELDALGPLGSRGTLDAYHLQDAVVEAGPDSVLVDPFGQLKAARRRVIDTSEATH